MKKKLRNLSVYRKRRFGWMKQFLKLSLIAAIGFSIILALLANLSLIDQWNRIPIVNLVEYISVTSQHKLNTKPQYSSPYRRKDWHVWASMGRCGNTRMQVLIRDDLTRHNPRPCKIKTGLWIDPYTGKIETITTKLDVDHIVPLKYANDNGGVHWKRAIKKQFGNDWDNLLVSNRSANRSKGHSDIVQWQPPNKAAWYSYAQRWQLIHFKYAIPIPPEQNRIIQWMSMFDESTNPMIPLVQLTDKQSWWVKAWKRWQILIYHLLIKFLI